MGRASCDRFEFDPIGATRWRSCDLCSAWKASALLHRADRVRDDDRAIDNRFRLLQQSEWISGGGTAWNYVAYPSSRAVRSDTAGFEKEVDRFANAGNFYPLLRAISD